MAEREASLLNPNQQKGLYNSSQDLGNNSAGFTFPYRIGSGVLQGNQSVGFGGVNIDSNNNKITVGNIVLDGNTNTIYTSNEDGSKAGIGIIPGTTNQFGFFATDSSGNVVWQQVGPTGTIFDVTNSKGIILDGKLPNGTYGSVISKTGTEVTDVFS
jgi:hypothetical protein